jgi:hypothetical protein
VRGSIRAAQGGAARLDAPHPRCHSRRAVHPRVRAPGSAGLSLESAGAAGADLLVLVAGAGIVAEGARHFLDRFVLGA